MRHVVIMAGGSGTRLWPKSRKSQPKQFQKLIGNDKTLLQQTFGRLSSVAPAEQVWVVTTKQYVDLVKEQLPQINQQHIIIEPAGRNTAPATGLATLTILREDPEAVITMVPADHYIGQENEFIETVQAVLDFLETKPEYVVTIGINPTEPNTGYGYIEMGEHLQTVGERKIFVVKSFHEKPDAVTAKKFVESWEFLWNGGYYLFKGTTMIEYFERLIPETLMQLQNYLADPTQAHLYTDIPAEPIDTAVAEKLEHLAVIPVDMEWSDIGNWATLHEILSKAGEFEQIAIGEHIGHNTDNSLIVGHRKLIATVGLKNVIVIDTEDALLVCDRDSVQDVKKIVEQLEKQEKHHLL